MFALSLPSIFTLLPPLAVSNSLPIPPFLLRPYGTGFTAGSLVIDTVHVAGLNIKSQKLGQADVMAKFFEDEPLDGILGLAFDEISEPKGVPTPFDNMISQKLLSKDLLQVFLSNDVAPGNTESVFLFGDIDESYVKPGASFFYVNVDFPSYWLIRMTQVTVGSFAHKCAFLGCAAVVDTGTTILAIPSNDAKGVIEAVGTVKSDCSNVDSLPTISLTISGNKLDLAPQYYVLKVQTSNSTECVLGIESIPVEEAGPLWILGDVVLRQYTTVWDRSVSPPRVGFAPANQPPPTF